MSQEKPKFDWNYLEWLYVTGDDRLTLEALSKRPNAPAFNTLMRRSAELSWTTKREQYRQNVARETRRVSAVDEAEVQGRHLKQAKALAGIGAKKLAKLWNPTTKTWNEEPSISEARLMIEAGVKLERLILGDSTENLSVSSGKAYLQAVFVIIREEVGDATVLGRIAERVRALGGLGSDEESPPKPN